MKQILVTKGKWREKREGAGSSSSGTTRARRGSSSVDVNQFSWPSFYQPRI